MSENYDESAPKHVNPDKGVVGKTVDATKDVAVKTGEAAKTATQAVIDNPGHSVVGAVVGTVLIPIPVVGTVVGAYIGGWFGEKNSK